MDFDHPKQIKGIINLVNLNFQEIKKINDIDDILPYITEKKNYLNLLIQIIF